MFRCPSYSVKSEILVESEMLDELNSSAPSASLPTGSSGPSGRYPAGLTASSAGMPTDESRFN